MMTFIDCNHFSIDIIIFSIISVLDIFDDNKLSNYAL